MDTVEQENQPTSLNVYRENLRLTFKEYLRPLVDNPQRRLRVLSVGSWFGYEAEPLLRIFPYSTYTGIEIDEDGVDAAQRMNKDLGERARFLVADARDPEALGTGWDIIIIRHPQITPNPIFDSYETAWDWRKIIQNSTQAVKPRGIFFISVQEGREREEVIGQLEEGGMEIIVSRVNEFPNVGAAFIDYWVIIGKKPALVLQSKK